MVSGDWETNALNTQAQVDELRTIRSGFLDVAIDIEIDLRAMLVGYFVDNLEKRLLFERLYESQHGLSDGSLNASIRF